ncbi:GRB2-associated-binding protein 2 [Cricetulus griseus]|nr:GRB2-associated-binding protein 2 [Cricetulus griseus]
MYGFENRRADFEAKVFGKEIQETHWNCNSSRQLCDGNVKCVTYLFSQTNECTFYLVAETEADMNRWVQSICQICNFSQTKESTDALRNLSSVSHSLCSSPAEFSSSSQHLLRARKSSVPSHSNQPLVSSHIQPALSISAPQEYQHLQQCISQRTENGRNASFSQSTRQESDIATQKLAQGSRHCINRVSGQVHDFYSLSKPGRHNTKFKDSAFDLPHSLASYSHTKGSLTGSKADSEDVYTIKAPGNTLCREFGDLLVDSAIAPPTWHPKTPSTKTSKTNRSHSGPLGPSPASLLSAPIPAHCVCLKKSLTSGLLGSLQVTGDRHMGFSSALILQEAPMLPHQEVLEGIHTIF